MDTNGIKRFLVIVFVLGYAIQIGSLASGMLSLTGTNLFQWILLAVIVFLPAIAAVIATLTAGNEEESRLEFTPKVWPIPIKPLLITAIVAPALFSLIYVVGVLLGFQEADFAMHEAVAQIRALSPQPLPEGSASMVGYLMLSVGLPASVVLGATVFALVGFGLEYGWRGYLLTRLLPLGRLKAALFVGLISFVWALPLLFSGAGADLGSAYLWITLLRTLVFFLATAVILAALLVRYQNVGLCAVFVGAIIAQHWSGIWGYLMPMGYAHVTGPFGIIGLLCWIALAVVAHKFGNQSFGEDGYTADNLETTAE